MKKGKQLLLLSLIGALLCTLCLWQWAKLRVDTSSSRLWVSVAGASVFVVTALTVYRLNKLGKLMATFDLNEAGIHGPVSHLQGLPPGKTAC